jgi:peptide/nickel transport system permease protein
MTEATIATTHAPDLTLARPDVPPTSLSRQVLSAVLRRPGARVGLTWIALLATGAAFAPVIANSHPILMKRGGRISSPMLQYLTPSDIVLQVAFWCAIVLYFLRIRFWTKVLTFVGVVILSLILSWIFVKPPEVIVYEQYRNWIRQGQVEWAIYPPVHYSPDDHQRDE